jgi:hypothetical protein
VSTTGQAATINPDPRVSFRSWGFAAGETRGWRRGRVSPVGCGGGWDDGADAVAVRAGCSGRGGGPDRAWRRAAAARGVSGQWRRRGAGRAGRDQAAQAWAHAIAAGGGTVQPVGGRRRALRRPGATARGRGAGAAARARPAGAADSQGLSRRVRPSGSAVVAGRAVPGPRRRRAAAGPGQDQSPADRLSPGAPAADGRDHRYRRHDPREPEAERACGLRRTNRLPAGGGALGGAGRGPCR